jgi:flagellar motor protein MotB
MELMRSELVDNSRLAAEGRGSQQPIGDNATAAGRQQNRRVEVTLFY